VIAKDKPRVAGATRRKGCRGMMDTRHLGEVDCNVYKRHLRRPNRITPLNYKNIEPLDSDFIHLIIKQELRQQESAR